MNFFKSVFSDDPVPGVDSPNNTDSNSPRDLVPDTRGTTDVGEWSFGGLIKSLTTRSESVIDTYRRDLKEFGSGLKKEIEVAQGSLETVGHVIDEFGSSVMKGTAQIISHGKDVILDADHESDSDNYGSQNYHNQRGSTSKPYCRFDAQVSAIQGDTNTYCEDPEELDDYNKWKLSFVLEDKNSEIDGLLLENGTVNTIHKKIVPSSVDNEAFWCRYFYRVHKLKQAEDLRVNLVKRAISREEEEELSWDVDDEEEEEGNDGKTTMGDKVGEESIKVEENESEKETKEVRKEKSEASSQAGSSPADDDENGRRSILPLNEGSRTNMEGPQVKLVAVESKSDHDQSGKDIDVSVVSRQPSMAEEEEEEEDLEWDEIEDLSSIDEKKVNQSVSPNKIDPRKRLNATEEDEDLSWDIEEEDDEPLKPSVIH